MVTVSNEDALLTPSLFPELDVTDVESSRYTAPTWVRANPRGRALRARRPSPVGRSAVDEAYDDLLSALDLEDGTARDVGKWAQRAVARIAEAVRVQVGDVDAVVCGSLTSGAHVRTAPWDVDVCVVAHAGPPAWDRDSHAALNDVARWITAMVGATATVDSNESAITIQSTGGLSVDVKVAWATPSAPGGLVRSRPGGSDGKLVPFAPAMHCERLRARDALLGRDGAFLKVLRIAKHVVRRWTARHGGAPLTSFELEFLALETLTQPFEVAEGVPFLFRRSAELARSSIPCALAADGRLVLAAPELATACLGDAADRCEEAMFAPDAAAASAALGDPFAA